MFYDVTRLYDVYVEPEARHKLYFTEELKRPP